MQAGTKAAAADAAENRFLNHVRYNTIFIETYQNFVLKTLKNK
jgi:hypothetical protein